MALENNNQGSPLQPKRFNRQGGRYKRQDESLGIGASTPTEKGANLPTDGNVLSGFQEIDSPQSFKRGSAKYSDFQRSNQRGRRMRTDGSNAKGSSGSHSFVGYSAPGGSDKKQLKPVVKVLVIVGALVVLAALAFLLYNLVSGSFGNSGADAGNEKTIFISEGSSTTEIAKLLKQEAIIKSESSFVADVKSRSAESMLKPGKYVMVTGSENGEIIDLLISGPAALGNTLTIPEGLTIEQTASIVEDVCGIPAADFIAEANSADKYYTEDPERYWFLENAYNNSAEGFLYPKTYGIPEGSDAAYVVKVLLDQFIIETSNLDLNYAREHNLNIYDVIIMASMIEKETFSADEKPKVSSVLYNRLQNDMKLQICATVVYALGPDSRDYGVNPLLYVDLEVDSPYNTYIHDGLPPGPICSPHIDSIYAAAHPDETDYLYYVLTSQDGTHTFCTNDEEFAAANEVYAEVFGL